MNHRKNKLIKTMLARRDWPEFDRNGLYSIETPKVPKTYISTRELNKYLHIISAPKTNNENKIYMYIGRLATIKRYVEGVIDFKGLLVPISILYYIANNYGINHFSNIGCIFYSLDRHSRNYSLKNTIHISNSCFHYASLIEINSTGVKHLINIENCKLDIPLWASWFEGNRPKDFPIKSLDIIEIDTSYSDDIEPTNARCFAELNGIYIIDNQYIKISCLTATLDEVEAQTFDKCSILDKEKFIEIRNLFIEEVRKHVAS